jgi:hypothetical protein
LFVYFSLLLLRSAGFWDKVKNYFSPPSETIPKEKRILEYIRSHNISLEKHETKTNDGYSLEIIRLAKPGGPVVFLQHGVMNSSATWYLKSFLNQKVCLWGKGISILFV